MITNNSLREDCSKNMITDFRCYDLHEQSEVVRWDFDSIQWGNIDKDKVTPECLDFVRSVANLEFTTYPGAMNFFREFSDDMDITQWFTLWLFEETRHPHVLMKWLSHFGHYFEVSDMKSRREIYPEGQSQVGTLCMNIISEMRATMWYLDLSKSTEDPVLKDITRKLAADESRHAAGFYTFAKKYISMSNNPDLECLRALEMLYVWLNNETTNRHPAGYFFPETSNQNNLISATTANSNIDKVDNRVCRMFGLLTGVPLKEKKEIKKYIRYYWEKINAN